LAFGVVFAMNSDLGTSPVASVPYVAALLLPISVGMLSTAMFLVFIAIQIAILRKQFKLLDLTQLGFAFVFGFFVDFAVFIMDGLQFPGYIGRLLMIIIGIILIAIAISFLITARLPLLPPESLCAAIEKRVSPRWPRFKFHIVKMCLDSVLVIIALSVSLIFLGEVAGVREGTVLSAIAIGKIIPYVRKALAPIFKLLGLG